MAIKNYSNKLADQIKEYNLLNKICLQLKEEFNLTTCVGAELEFYLIGNYDVQTLAEKINLTIKKEKGCNQFEIDLSPSIDIANYADSIKQIRQDIINHSMTLGFEANFSSKPFADDYGSSMHIHLNFQEDTDVEKYAKILCHYTKEYLDIFLPTDHDRRRLDSKFMAPTHISYGGNNRSVLVRIPDLAPRRLEYRLAAASADPSEVIYAILFSILRGLRNPLVIQPISKTYGNAYDEQYKLIKILSSS
jgi:glutamine synthetase